MAADDEIVTHFLKTAHTSRRFKDTFVWAMGNFLRGPFAIALDVMRCRLAYGPLLTLVDLIIQLGGVLGRKKLQRLLKQLHRLHLLVVDELGYVPFSKAGAELLFEVISRAYEHHGLLLTTNLPFEEWTETLGSEWLSGALLDRLTHRSSWKRMRKATDRGK